MTIELAQMFFRIFITRFEGWTRSPAHCGLCAGSRQAEYLQATCNLIACADEDGPINCHRLRTSFRPFLCRWTRGRNAVLSGVVLAFFVALSAFAASPALHHELHHDSDHPDHSCFIKQFSDGQIDVAAGWVEVPLPVMLPAELAVPKPLILVAVDYRLLPGRAPPAFLP